MNEHKNETYNLITVLGPTASGKTGLAVQIASKTDGEIISADSRQVYRGMDIGTGKDINEYYCDGKNIPYHLIDIADAGYKYNVYEFQRDFVTAFNAVIKRNKMPVLCGGTGLYLEAVLKGYKLVNVPKDPDLRDKLKHKTQEELKSILVQYKKLHNKTDLETKRRAIRAIEIASYYAKNSIDDSDYPVLKSLNIGILIDRYKRRSNITKRLKSRLKEGMIDEVKELLNRGIRAEDLIYYGLEYKYVTLYLTGKLTYDAMFQELEIAIHQFGKRQMTWFRGMERRGTRIHWIDYNLPDQDKTAIVKGLLDRIDG